MAIAGVVVLVVLTGLYLGRRVIAREALTAWLRSHGVASETQVRAFGPGGFTGRLRVGDPKAPDFEGDAQVTYGLRGLTFEVRSVTLTRPLVRASLRGGKLSFGALDPIIDDLLKRPPRPGAAKPDIAVNKGVLLLASDYGPVRLTADARMRDGKLQTLNATTAPTRLRSPRFDASLGAGALDLTTQGDRVDILLDLPVLALSVGDFGAAPARLRLIGQAAYPDLEHRRLDGPLTLRASLEAGRLGSGGQKIAGAQLSAAFGGAVSGWLDTLTLAGRASADLVATASDLGPAVTGPIHAHADAPDLRWSRKGGDAVSATPRISAELKDVAAAQLGLAEMTTALRGPAAFRGGEASAALVGRVDGRGAWSGLGPPTALDSAQIVAIKRAARGFRVAAPGISLKLAKGQAEFHLPKPARLLPERGGEAALAERGGGAWRLTTGGGGLPATLADLSQVRLADGGGTANGRVKASLSTGPLEGAVIDASGTLRLAGGGATFAGDRCAAITVERVELGANDVLAVEGQLCPGRAPLVTVKGGDWRITGRAAHAGADIPFLQAGLREASGDVDLGLAKGQLRATAAIASAEVRDLAPEPRFHPLRMAGTVGLAHTIWQGDLSFRTPAGQLIARAVLRHDGTAGAGGVNIETGTLVFAPDGLQPTQLSPLAAALGSPAEGKADFSGHFDWTAEGSASGGVLDIPRLDFQSPAGRVTGLSGRIGFTSLAPLIAAPGQTLRAESLATPAAVLTGASVTFELRQQALVISGGEAAVGGGKVQVESLTVPFQPGAPVSGALRIEGVQLHDLVEASPFGDRADLDAKVSGRVPFESQGGRVRILGGDLHAIQPGRLSINRAALSAVSASGQVATPATTAPVQANDTFTDFAYQAMENLAFDKLDAGVATQADGRLGVLFHIVGRHDPPQHQEIRLSLADLIGRKFLGRRLPLPSDTGVDLTLDTTLNLDDLLRDYADYQKLRGSRGVQP